MNDLKFAFRQLLKNPGFTAVAVLTLALGIGAATAIFTVVYGVLLLPLPYENPSQIVQMWEVNALGQKMNFADPNFEDIRAQSRSLQGLAEYGTGPMSVSGVAEPTRTAVASVSRDFFAVMRVEPVFGRGFAAEDHRFGAPPVALVSDRFWKQFLGSATDLSGIKLSISDYPVSVLGVLPAGFRFPDDSDIWIPRELFERLPSRSAHNWRVVGRLSEGVSLKQAHAECATIASRLKRQYGQDTLMEGVALSVLQDAMTGRVRPTLTILFGAAGFLLLIAFTNVANLLLTRMAARQRELAVRAALGASRVRLGRQLVTEACGFCMMGGGFGILVAFWGVQVLLAMVPPELPRLGNVSINLPVLFFALGVSLVIAVVLGIFGCLRVGTGPGQTALADHARSQTYTRTSPHLGRSIIAGQLAITLVLLVGAGLLGRSLIRALSVDPGFHIDHVVTLELGMSSAGQESDKVRRVQFLDRLFERMRGIQGVQEVGGIRRLPFTGPLPDGTYVVMKPGEQVPRSMEALDQWFHDASDTGYASYCPASGGYFRAVGIPLLKGRVFDDRDTLDAPHVALISESLAREKWPDQDPQGRVIEFGNMDGDLRPLTIVGVVGDVRQDSVEATPRPTIYVNYRQRPQTIQNFTVVLHTSGEPTTVISATRQILKALDAKIPLAFSTFTRVASLSLRARYFNVVLVGVFAGAALLLAAIGLYGLLAYGVTQRTREIGVRVALGAQPSDVLGLVLRQGMKLVGLGILAGIGGALALTRTLRSLLFGISPGDPLTFALISLLLAAVALLACYLPARRAAKVDPMEALRYE